MNNTILPKRKVYKTPRLLLGDAYTIGSNKFESDKAKQKSEYYITFRKKLHTINPSIYSQDDNRIIMVGIQRILDKLFYDPITHQEIDETVEFLKYAKYTTKGFVNYDFPEDMWREVVDKYNGRPPILIRGLSEGSVVYPNEPSIIITSLVDDMGVLAAWFESKLLQIWGPSERVTQSEHVLLKLKQRIKLVEPNMPEDQLDLIASTMITDFGDRAGLTLEESEELGMTHLYSFCSTDTFSGAYQAYKNCIDSVGIFSSVNALAHRNVQSYEFENDCYKAIYNSCNDNELVSLVDDCYDAKNSVRNYLLPLALKSKAENNGKVVICRPDSEKPGYTMIDQILEICDLAIENGLYTEITTETGTWKFGNLFRFLDGDGQTFDDVFRIIDILISKKLAFYSWGIFGMGGNFRNGLKRDNLSAKYALASVGHENIGVVKFSESLGKSTIPGPFKLLRDQNALENKQTVVHISEQGEDSMVVYFDGSNINKPFGPGFDDDFITIKNRIKQQMNTMPLSLETQNNFNYPMSEKLKTEKSKLMKKYTTNK